MGFAALITPCICCGRIFSCNPHKVPSSSALTGEREPVCRDCYERLQRTRERLGLDPWPDPQPGAYEPIEEHEL